MTNPNLEIATAANLIGIYRLLAHVYRKELSAVVVNRLDEHGLLNELETWGYNIEREKLKSDEFLLELSREYARVFIGPGKHVSPYGSVYHPDDPKKGRLWGDSTAWVRNFVADHGIEFKGNAYDGIPDHIGHELEFFAVLIEHEAKARHAGDDEKAERLLNSQKIFFTQQLGKWIPLFCEKVPQTANLAFYKEIARFTNDFISLEMNRLGEPESVDQPG